MSDILVKFHNTSQVRLEFPNNYGIAHQLHDYFSFFVDGYKFHPKFKARMWDGKIRLFDLGRNTLDYGLVYDLVAFAKEQGYSIDVEEGILINNDVTIDQLETFCVDVLKLPFEPRYYQLEAAQKCLKNGRRIILANTGAGKSLIMYIVYQWLIKVEKLDKILVVVPNVGLVTQLLGDFADYAKNITLNDEFLLIPNKEGLKDTNEAKCIISTWQSLYKLEDSYFDKFDALFSDEVHTLTGKASSQIAKKTINTPIKIAMTGTLSNKSKTNETQLRGMYGPVYEATNTQDLIADGTLSEVQIKCIELKHPKNNKLKYQDEAAYLRDHDGRANYMCDIASKLKGNTIMLATHISQIDYMVDYLRGVTDKEVFKITGSSSKEERELIRTICKERNDVIIVGTYPVLQAGINIPSLHNLMFCFPSKSVIRVIQSIGRVLRRHSTKDKAVVLDFYDDMSGGASQNHTLKHFLERYQIYSDYGFNVDVIAGRTFTE